MSSKIKNFEEKQIDNNCIIEKNDNLLMHTVVITRSLFTNGNFKYILLPMWFRNKMLT